MGKEWRIAVILLGVAQVGDKYLSEGELLFRDAEQRGAAGREPLGDMPVVFEPAGFRAMRAEIMTLAIDLDDCLTAGLVSAIARNKLNKTRLNAVSPKLPRQTGMYPFGVSGNAALPTVDR